MGQCFPSAFISTAHRNFAVAAVTGVTGIPDFDEDFSITRSAIYPAPKERTVDPLSF
jgi:hypothetical protein